MTIVVSGVAAGYEEFRLASVSLTVAEGSLTALIGPNGCGKSTLLKAIAGFLPAATGSVEIGERDIKTMGRRHVARRVAVLPQQPVIPPGVTVEQLVGYGRAPYQNLLGIRSADDRAIIDDAMGIVDLGSLRDRPISGLSGGQRQRAFIAMCIAQQTPYMLFDEPTSFLDIKYQYEVLDLLSDLHTQGKTIVVVLHDIAQAARYATDLVVMRDGAVYAQGRPSDIVTSKLVSDVYDLPVSVYPDPVTGTAVVSPLREKGH